MKRLVIGILAHVDSGKTTLSEAMLYTAGALRKLGRVDHKDAFLDTDALERARGITIFSKQAILKLAGAELTLLDTPGHVDFSAEAERALQVMDYAVLVISGTDGVQSHTETLWRLLERYGVPVFIFVNKLDLAAERPDELDEFIAIYETAGYAVYPVSATEGTGLETLRELTAGKTTLLTGNSGAGKSTLIKALVPDADVRINRISEYHHKGMHTTTFARMYPLAGGGNIIDTPGIKGFGLVDIEPGEVFRYFPEFMRHSPDCQYYNCTHTHEPGCAVTAAVERGDIAPQRYISYIKLLDEDGKYRQ